MSIFFSKVSGDCGIYKFLTGWVATDDFCLIIKSLYMSKASLHVCNIMQNATSKNALFSRLTVNTDSVLQ